MQGIIPYLLFVREVSGLLFQESLLTGLLDI